MNEERLGMNNIYNRDEQYLVGIKNIYNRDEQHLQ